jgi:hypothetical protein
MNPDENDYQVKRLVEAILNRVNSPSRERLLPQSQTICNVSGGLAFFSFEVDRAGTKPELGIPNPLPCRPEVLAADGTYFGDLMVWRDNAGYIDSLEYSWWGDEPPSALPSLDDLRFP